MQTRFAGMTDTGLLREHNEDSLLLLPEYGIVAVADGMGGHRSGDVASQLAISTLSDFFSVVVGRDGTWPFPADPNLTEEENYVITGLRLANRRIFDRSLRTMADFGMGTTIVAAIFTKKADKVTVGHVGDSRCYRIRGDEIHQMTRDHSLVNDYLLAMPELTEEQKSELPKNVITRALGMQEHVTVDLQGDDATVGDCYVLCSDGLSGMIEDSEILEIVAGSPTIEEACRKLIALANEHGGEDNITAVLVKIEDEPGSEKVSLSDTLPTPLTARLRQGPGPTEPDAHADTPPAGETKPKG